MSEKPQERRIMGLNMETQDFIGMILVIIGLITLIAEWPGPPSFSVLDYIGIGLIITGFLIFLIGGWTRIERI